MSKPSSSSKSSPFSPSVTYSINQPRLRSSSAPTYRTAYGPKSKVSLSFPAQGRTKQSFKDECDINVIMGRYMKTGVLNFVNRFAPQYSDVSGIDYQEAMFTVAQARSMFQQLPAQIRDQFRNDPAQFLDFVHDPANAAEMAQMGLLTPEATARLAQAEKATPPLSIQKDAPKDAPKQPSTPSKGSDTLVPGDQA